MKIVKLLTISVYKIIYINKFTDFNLIYFLAEVCQEPIDRVGAEEIEVEANPPTTNNESSTRKEISFGAIYSESKTTSVPVKKQKTIPEDKFDLESEIPTKSEEKIPEAKSLRVMATKGKVQIPKGLTVTTISTAKVQDLFDFSPESQIVMQDETSVTLRSEDATTPIHEDPIPSFQASLVCEDTSGEPVFAEEAPILQEDQVELEAPTEEEPKEPEFDYFGCEICRNEAKPVDLEQLIFNHKCPICPCACFCAHLLKEHMRVIHGWFNVQRRFTQY